MSVELGESEKKKPATVECYDKAKCAVGMAYQMATQLFRQSRHPSVARCGFLQHSGFGRHQRICALQKTNK